MLLGNLIHLSYNMWCDRDYPDAPADIVARPYLRFDEALWRDVLDAMAQAGMNAVVLDLGDGVRWQSHPEISVDSAWSGSKLRSELDRARSMGIEPIPKLNFSTAHDAWLGEMGRKVSTAEYYRICGDLIEEACELFDGPRFFHLGMDEETFEHQRHYAYAVVRQHELWWNDLLFLVETVEKAGARAWIWSDYVWHHPEDFYVRMPHSVLQSNWYYGEDFESERGVHRVYDDLAARGYDQVPTGSNWSTPRNFLKTVSYCLEQIPPERLTGFLMAPWKPTLEAYRDHHMAAVAQVRVALERVVRRGNVSEVT